MPSEYKKLEYIESTGTQWLNIGPCSNHTYFDIDFAQVSYNNTVLAKTYSQNGLIGVNGSTDGLDCKVWLGCNREYIGFNGNSRLWYSSLSLGVRVHLYCSFNKVIYNGVVQTITPSTQGITSNDCYVFTVNPRNESAADWASNVRIYSLKTSSINLIPALRKSDTKPGLYDTVTKTFFVNQGTGVDFSYPTS